jgi:hypothetical protein
MEVIHSCETSVHIRTTWCCIPEDGNTVHLNRSLYPRHTHGNSVLYTNEYFPKLSILEVHRSLAKQDKVIGVLILTISCKPFSF